MGVATPTAPAFALPFQTVGPVNVSIQTNLQIAPAPAQPVMPQPSPVTNDVCQVPAFDPAYPQMERAGFERMLSVYGTELLAAAHYSAAPNCMCLTCTVRRAADADLECMRLAVARREHYLVLETPFPGSTNWCLFSRRDTGARINSDWESFASGLQQHAAVILD